jgi:hypothetical protein
MTKERVISMPGIRRLATTALLAIGLGITAPAAPASAASNPAVTGCSFTPIYTSYEDNQLIDPRYYYPRDTALTVTDGDGQAWHVTVDRNGDTGWMDAGCVLFLA